MLLCFGEVDVPHYPAIMAPAKERALNKGGRLAYQLPTKKDAEGGEYWLGDRRG